VLKLFDDYNGHISTEILLKARGLKHLYSEFGKPYMFSGLHSVSFLGIVEFVACLVKMEGCDINQEDYARNTPLLLAAQYGHKGVVEILLGRDGIKPNERGRYC